LTVLNSDAADWMVSFLLNKIIVKILSAYTALKIPDWFECVGTYFAPF
jgi:hypothetical protein